jgi:hypothetical protein
MRLLRQKKTQFSQLKTRFQQKTVYHFTQKTLFLWSKARNFANWFKTQKKHILC